MKSKKTLALIVVTIISLSGCSAVSTAVKKRNLEVKTAMSETIWLDPVSSDKRTIFIQTRNVTDKEVNIEQELSSKLVSKGYSVIQDPDKAHYWIQANILKLDKMDLREAQGFLSSGYGGALSGAAAGLLAASAFTKHSNSIAGAGLIGGAVGLVADSLVEDVNYALITDIRVVEKTDQEIQSKEMANLTNGNSGATNTVVTSVDNKKRFQTRILSNANKVNLDFEEAKPALIDDLTTSISGIF